MSSSPEGTPNHLTPLDDLTPDVEMNMQDEFIAGRYSAPISQERLSHSVDPSIDAVFGEERWAEDYTFQRWPRDNDVPAEMGSSPDRSAGQTRTASLVPLPSSENFQSPSGSKFSSNTSLFEPLELANIHTPFMSDSQTPEAAVDASFSKVAELNESESTSSSHVIADASSSMEPAAVEPPTEAVEDGLPKSPVLPHCETETTATNGDVPEDVEMDDAAMDNALAVSEPPIESELSIDVIPPTDSEPNSDSTPPIDLETNKESTLTADSGLDTDSSPSLDADVNKESTLTTESELPPAESDANTSVVDPDPDTNSDQLDSTIPSELVDTAPASMEAAEPDIDVPSIDSEPQAGDDTPAKLEAKAGDSTPVETETKAGPAFVDSESKSASAPAVEEPRRDPSNPPSDPTPASDTIPSVDPSTSATRAESAVPADSLPFNESVTADASGEEDDEEEENELTIEEVRLKNPGKLVRQATNGTFIIEEIVTPESRRAKAFEKRKAKSAAPQESDSKSLGCYREDEVLESGTLGEQIIVSTAFVYLRNDFSLGQNQYVLRCIFIERMNLIYQQHHILGTQQLSSTTT